jgi:glycosyltransferase involved in cell wall biosynthesis
MDKPWLSVIIPSHNRPHWLAIALQSIVDQKEQGIEVVVVDGSLDTTSLETINDFNRDLYVRSFRRTDLQSWTAKTNFGVEQAKGDRICMLHDDDFWLPNRSIEIQKWLSTQADAVMHLHSCYIVDEAGKQLGLWNCPLPGDGSPIPTYTLFERLLVQNFIATPAPTIRRDAYLTVGGLDDSLWRTADWDLYLKIASLGNIYYYPGPLACYRIHKNALTVAGKIDTTDFITQHRAVVDRHIEKLPTETRKEVFRIATTSINVNADIAAAYAGNYWKIAKAFLTILSLGPRGIHQYFYRSRITDRLLPRIRALVAGNL